MSQSETVGENSARTENVTEESSATYLEGDVLLTHIKRQAKVVWEALHEDLEIPTTVHELSRAYEKNIFCPKNIPKKQENGTLEPNPRLNFYPTFGVPETLATYHIFFSNQKIPLSCKINRPAANEIMHLKAESHLPDFSTVEEVKRIFEGLGAEELAKNALQQENTHLIELENDGPRAAVLKRATTLTHFAYPAINLPPKIMNAIMDNLVMKHTEAKTDADNEAIEDNLVVSDEDIIRWFKINGSEEEVANAINEKRKTMMAVILVTLTLECLQKFFTSPAMIKKIGETLHYTFKHGFVKQAIKTSNVDITNVITYMGIMHENRVGQTVLHHSLKGENRLDYVRDTIYLFLIYTWQTAMGVWQQCMEPDNLKELSKILQKHKKALWTGDSEGLIAADLCRLVFPENLMSTLQNGLPDITNQSMLQHFRDFILERSGLLPAMCCALPTDFVPIHYNECPPPLWPYTYLLKLANYFMYHNDLQTDSSGEGLLDCYCRCNLCTPHRCVATNTALLNEIQSIGTFELQGPPTEDGTLPTPLKLTSGLWTSAYLRKFEEADYYPYKIHYYEDQKTPKTKAELTACVITQSQILAQLQSIKKAREEFLIKKGHGVYLDPHTGEELTAEANSHHNEHSQRKQQPARGGSGADKPSTFPGRFPEQQQHRSKSSLTPKQKKQVGSKRH